MATLNSTGLTFSNGSSVTGAGRIVAVRYAYSTSQFSNSSQYADDHLNVEVTMPPAASNDSRYIIMGESNTNDSNSSTKGAGIEIWVETSGGGGSTNSYWVCRPGTHSHYHNEGSDKYYCLHNFHLDDGAGTYQILAGQTRKYRLYGQNHNGNVYWNAGVGGQEGARTKLIVMEIDGSLI